MNLPSVKTFPPHDRVLSLTVLPDLLRLRPEGDVGLFQVEQSPRLGAKVGPVEAGQRHVVAVEAHGAAQLHGVLGQRHLEEGDVAAGDYLQHPGPVAVVGRIHVCGTEREGFILDTTHTCCCCSCCFKTISSLKRLLLGPNLTPQLGRSDFNSGNRVHPSCQPPTDSVLNRY